MANDEQVPKIVVDTNVLVSGIINPFGLPRQLLDAWDAERLELLTSTELIDEVVRVLHRSRIRTKYGVTSERITTLHTRLERTATVVTPLSNRRGTSLHPSLLGTVHAAFTAHGSISPSRRRTAACASRRTV